ncbi:MAG: stage V sporulation protein AD, partial [Bacilli bacterium]|nr:stage V sporulation protein AD [Bacilli bacterium]
MTFTYNNVYINETSLIAGPYEKKGPLGNSFDKVYDDLYFGEKTWEQAESKLIEESVDILLNKTNKKKKDINLHLSGDLLNQIVATNYASAKLGIPLLGLYSACATSVEGLIVGANMIEAGQIKNCISSVSSHNNAAEKQFRYPVEYGGPKPKTATFTATGGTSAYLSTTKKGIKIESGTVGTVSELGITDPYHMGAVMAPSAGD